MEEPVKSAGMLVYVVDDEDELRGVVARVVRSFGYETQDFPSAEAFLEAYAPERPACLVCDVHLTRGSGLDLFAELERRRISLPTVFITGAGTIPMGVQAMKAGAVEFLTKPISWDTLREALAQAVARAEAQAATRAEESGLRALLSRLTPRESDVLPYVVRGMLNKQIAAELSIVEQTVKVHRSRIMEKLEVDSVADLVRLTERINALGIEVAARDGSD